MMVLAGLLAAMITASAQPAAPAKTPPPDVRKILDEINKDPMQVVVVEATAEHCAPSCPRWIAAQGTINEDTQAAFAKALKQAGKDKLPVFINSRGGRIDTAQEIGRMLRKAGLVVAVGITEFEGCAPTDAKCSRARDFKGYRGRITSYAAFCASSCPFILAGGVRRYVPPFALAGVHEITNFQRPIQQQFLIQYRMEGGKRVEVSRQLVSQKVLAPKMQTAAETGPVYRQMRKYLAEMGISDELVTIALTAKREEMHWLTDDERRTTRLVTEVKSDDDLAFAPFPLEPAGTAAASDWSVDAMAGPGAGFGSLNQLQANIGPAATTPTPPLPLEEAFAMDGMPHASLWEAATSSGPRTSVGSVTCETVTDLADDTGGEPVKVTRALASIPGLGLSLDFALRPNADPSLRASHLIELRFTPSPGLDGRQVSSVIGLLARSATAPRGERLKVSIEDISTGSFWLALPADAGDRASNAELLRSHRQLDIRIRFDDGRQGTFAIDCGDAGRKMLVDNLAMRADGRTAAQ